VGEGEGGKGGGKKWENEKHIIRTKTNSAANGGKILHSLRKAPTPVNTVWSPGVPDGLGSAISAHRREDESNNSSFSLTTISPP